MGHPYAGVLKLSVRYCIFLAPPLLKSWHSPYNLCKRARI